MPHQPVTNATASASPARGTDDDLLDTPKVTGAFRELGFRRRLQKRFASAVEIACAAHLVTTTSRRLASIYREAGVRDVAVIENQLAPHGLLPARRRTRGRVTIGYVAAEEHITEARQLRLAEVLRGLLDANPRVHLVTVGLLLDIDHPRYTYRQLVPIERLIDTISDFDVGIAPLVDTPFNRARSNVKLKEYAAAGAAWLASPVGPYAGLGEAQGGLLVEDGAWHRVLEELAGDSARREQLARRASAWARRQTIVQTGRVWEEAFRGAIARARAERRSGVSPSSAPPAAQARPSA